MKTFKEYLVEKTFNLDMDVDFIYNMSFKEFIEKLNTDNSIVLRTMTFGSDILRSKLAKRANKINPITINTGVFEGGSFYYPIKSRIDISFNMNVYEYIINYGSVELALARIPKDLHKRFMNEVNGVAVKQTIYHELSHWVDDTFHNKHITKMTTQVDKSSDTKQRHKIVYQGNPDTTMTKYEINAQIHNVKNAKKENSKIWNKITFSDLLNLSPSLGVIHRKLGLISYDAQQRWRREIKHRMYREGLLGKRMA